MSAPTPAMSAAVYLDLESGAQRIALRTGETSEAELIGAVNSGDPQTLEQFLLWAFDACPARRYILVMAGLGIMDTDSVVGRRRSTPIACSPSATIARPTMRSSCTS